MKNKVLDWIHFVDVDRVIHFEDLEFNPHLLGNGAVQATGHFPINGKWYSVVGGGVGLYGDGVTTFEVLGDDMDDVIGWLTKDEVEEWVLEMQS